MGERDSCRDVVRVERVQEELRLLLEDYQRNRRSRSRRRVEGVPFGLEPLDRALPHGGLPGGAVTEILFAAAGVGATSLALSAANRAAGERRAVVVIETARDFYPPAAADAGIDPDRLLVVRPRRAADAIWVADQSLRCPAVGAVVARLDRLTAAESRRLQLAAESGGNLGLLVRPVHLRERTFAAVQLLIESVPTPNPPASQAEPPGIREGVMRFCRITLLKVREGRPAGPFIVGLDDEAGFVPLHAATGHRAPARGLRAAGA